MTEVNDIIEYLIEKEIPLDIPHISWYLLTQQEELYFSFSTYKQVCNKIQEYEKRGEEKQQQIGSTSRI